MAAPRATPAQSGWATSRLNSKNSISSALATTWAENQTVPCTATKKYTLPNANSTVRYRFWRSVRALAPLSESLRSSTNSRAGASPASSAQNSASRVAVPQIATAGRITSAGKGGNETYQVPL